MNVVMSLKDFYFYIKEFIEAHDFLFYIEKKESEENIFIEQVNYHDYRHQIDSDRDKFLNFFILPTNLEVTKSSIYEDDTAPFVIVGEGGRERKDSVERINLRILSKSPEKNTAKIFNSIRNKLKKDEDIGMGVEGGSSLHDQYFYQIALVGKKIFKTDFHNPKAPFIVTK